MDRIYIARIPSVGTYALGAIGLCFPLIVIINAFANLFGSGGAPLFSISRGEKNKIKANLVMNTSFTMLVLCSIVLMIVSSPLLKLHINLIWNIYIRYEICLSIYDDLSNRNTNFPCAYFGYESIYQCTRRFNGRYVFGFDWCHYEFSARPNIYFPVWAWYSRRCHRNPLFFNVFQLSLCIALKNRSELKVRLLKKEEWIDCKSYAQSIISLGSSSFIMQLTNS